MCVSLLSVLIVLKLCIFLFFALCFSVFVYLFIVMSCLLPFFVYFGRVQFFIKLTKTYEY